jgi:DNA-binding SARP family transcriptional activator
MPSVPALTLTLLGPPSLQLAGGTALAPQPGAKALALLAFLTLDPGPHSREELASLLWGESSESEARASLRQTLKQLRQVLGETIRTDRTAVELAEPLACDVRSFQHLVLQDPGRASQADIPRFLAGFSVRNAPRFDEWVAQTKRDLLRQYHQALGTLAREAMGRWQWREAAELAERWLSGDPLSDEAVRLAIEARYLSGDRGGALTEFMEYRDRLKRDTGCEPSRLLLGLIQRIEADATPAASRPVTDEWYARGPSFEASLIGREPEWGELLRAWKAVAGGTGSTVVIEGETGVGKSRLAEEFVRWIVAEGGTALRGHGYDERGSVAFEPIVEVLRDALAAPGVAGTAPEWLAEVARLLPEIHQRFRGLPKPVIHADPAEEWRLFEGVAQLVLAVAAERSLAILLDDLQWCDEDSCRLIRFLIRRTERAPVLWLIALNPGELDREHAAARLLRSLRSKAHVSVLALSPLSKDQLWSMVHQMGHVSTPEGAKRFAERLFRVCGGNPFYAIELLKTMFAQGLLAVDGESGCWTPAPGALLERSREFPISSSVHHAIAERVERLPEPLRELLVTLAVSGTACGTELLSRIHGISRMHAAALADALVERRLVAEVGGAYRSVHPIIARVVRDRLSPSRLQEVHRLLAFTLEHLSQAGDSVPYSAEIARHADLAGEAQLAYRFALLTAKVAKEGYAYSEALSWLDVASRNAGEGDDAQEVKRLTALVLDAAGLRDAPPVERLGGPITRGLNREDFDLPVPG